MEDTLDYIKNCLFILTAVGAIIWVFVKVMGSFFIESLKNKYKYIPGQQSSFKIIINIVSTIIFSIEFITLVVIIFFMFFNGNELSILTHNNLYWNLQYSGLIDAIIFSIPLLNTLVIIETSSKLRYLFIDKLHNKPIEHSFKKYKSIVILSIFISGIILVVFSAFILLGNLERQDIQTNIILGILILACSTNILISKSLMNVISELSLDVNYIFYMGKKEIKCKCYLEYSEFYLILENGVQSYIKKSEIYKIEKIEINKRNRNRKRKSKDSNVHITKIDAENSAS